MQIHDVADYVTHNIPRPTFYIQDILPKQGTMLLYGATGIKKSWLAEWTGFCIATGDDWFGLRTEQARVLIVNFEMSQAGYHWRLRDMIGNFTLEEQMFYEASPNLLMLEDRAVFDRFAEDIRPIHPQVIILDCLQKCYGGNENSKEEMLVFVQHIEELMIEHQASVIIIHHENRNILSTSPMDRSRGTTLIPGWVDTVIHMTKQPSGLQLQFGKTRQATREIHNVNIQFDNYNWTRRGEM